MPENVRHILKKQPLCWYLWKSVFFIPRPLSTRRRKKNPKGLVAFIIVNPLRARERHDWLVEWCLCVCVWSAWTNRIALRARRVFEKGVAAITHAHASQPFLVGFFSLSLGVSVISWWCYDWFRRFWSVNYVLIDRETARERFVESVMMGLSREMGCRTEAAADNRKRVKRCTICRIRIGDVFVNDLLISKWWKKRTPRTTGNTNSTKRGAHSVVEKWRMWFVNQILYIAYIYVKWERELHMQAYTACHRKSSFSSNGCTCGTAPFPIPSRGGGRTG